MVYFRNRASLGLDEMDCRESGGADQRIFCFLLFFEVDLNDFSVSFEGSMNLFTTSVYGAQTSFGRGLDRKYEPGGRSENFHIVLSLILISTCFGVNFLS